MRKFIIDDEPLRGIKRAVVGTLNWLRRRGAGIGRLAKALRGVLPSPSVTLVIVDEPSRGESRSGLKRYERISLTDAVALTIMQRYGIEELFPRDRELAERRR
jgi:predicted nucleic acid-binding protein